MIGYGSINAMKIGFFGNTNNYPFMLARAFRRLGHDVRFVVNRPDALHRPESRYADIPRRYPDWIHDASPLDTIDVVLPTPKRARVLELLQDCDAVILNELGPALLPKLRRPAIVLLTGSDLEYYADPRSLESYRRSNRIMPVWKRWILELLLNRTIRAQRNGIRLAETINYFGRGLVPDGDRLLEDIGVNTSRRVFFMMTDVDELTYTRPPKNGQIRVFCATRLTWKKPIAPGRCELDYKGSDIMIRGLAMFLHKTSVPLDIRLVRKGMHVRETEQLIDEEGIGRYVTWKEEMTQSAVLDEFRAADIVFEQLGQSVVGMAGLDAMAVGRPVIANGRSEIMEAAIGAPSPICQACTPEEVCGQLERLVFDEAEREHVGRASRAYVERYFSADRAAKLCLERLQVSDLMPANALVR